MDGIEIIGKPQIVEDVATKKKYVLMVFPGMAAPDNISNCAMEIGGRTEIQLKNKKITVNLLF
jgi:hypothetical protein